MGRTSGVRPGSELDQALRVLVDPAGHSLRVIRRMVARVNGADVRGFAGVIREVVQQSPIVCIEEQTGRVALIDTLCQTDDAPLRWLASATAAAEMAVRRHSDLQCNMPMQDWRFGRPATGVVNPAVLSARKLDAPRQRMTAMITQPLISSLGLATAMHCEHADPHASYANAEATLQFGAVQKALVAGRPAFETVHNAAATQTYELRDAGESAALLETTQAIGKYWRISSLFNSQRPGRPYPFLQAVEVCRQVLFAVDPDVATLLRDTDRQDAANTSGSLGAEAVELLGAVEPAEFVPLASVLWARQAWQPAGSRQ